MRGGLVIATWPARRGRGTRCDSPGLASSQQFHEIAPAAETLLEGRDISRLFGGRAQAAHAGDEGRRLVISGTAAAVRELVDAPGIDLQSLARMVGLAFASEAFFHGP